LNYFFVSLLVLASFSLGFDYFYHFVFNKGMIFTSVQQKQIPMKFVLSATLKVFIILKSLLIIPTFIAIVIILLLQIKISILSWSAIIFSIFNGTYFMGYLLPKLRRIIHWDIKNPIEKWDELYKGYNSSSKILVMISAINLLLVFVSLIIELMR